MDYTELLKQLAAKCEAAQPRVEGDYVENGLIHCGKCRTAKQAVIPVMNQPMKVSCMCKCATEAYEARRREDAEREQLYRIQRLQSQGFPEQELRACTFDLDDDPENPVSRKCRGYVRRFDQLKPMGRGLLLYGPVGTGKTFLAACVANELMRQGRPCLVTSFNRITNQLAESPQGRQAFIDNLRQYELVVLDDLASERDTEYMGEIVNSVIDARYRQGLPMIVTTNLSPAELKSPAQIRRQRSYSRLLERCFPLELSGPDRRKQRLARDYAAFKQMLES